MKLVPDLTLTVDLNRKIIKANIVKELKVFISLYVSNRQFLVMLTITNTIGFFPVKCSD